MESFCDYFIINEYLTSYDAGLHSTYFYKDIGGKIKMGPVWDFDGALDNGSHTLTDYNYIVMKQRPWFECMIQDPVFVNKLCDRYKELRKGILSDENVKEKATEGLKFLGNAIERDSVRWGTEYEASSLDEVVEMHRGRFNESSILSPCTHRIWISICMIFTYHGMGRKGGTAV